MAHTKPNKNVISVDGKDRSAKAIYIGVNGVPVKVWDEDAGVVYEELFAALKKAVSGVG